MANLSYEEFDTLCRECGIASNPDVTPLDGAGGLGSIFGDGVAPRLPDDSFTNTAEGPPLLDTYSGFSNEGAFDMEGGFYDVSEFDMDTLEGEFAEVRNSPSQLPNGSGPLSVGGTQSPTTGEAAGADETQMLSGVSGSSEQQQMTNNDRKRRADCGAEGERCSPPSSQGIQSQISNSDIGATSKQERTRQQDWSSQEIQLHLKLRHSALKNGLKGRDVDNKVANGLRGCNFDNEVANGLKRNSLDREGANCRNNWDHQVRRKKATEEFAKAKGINMNDLYRTKDEEICKLLESRDFLKEVTYVQVRNIEILMGGPKKSTQEKTKALAGGHAGPSSSSLCNSTIITKESVCTIPLSAPTVEAIDAGVHEIQALHKKAEEANNELRKSKQDQNELTIVHHRETTQEECKIWEEQWHELQKRPEPKESKEQSELKNKMLKETLGLMNRRKELEEELEKVKEELKKFESESKEQSEPKVTNLDLENKMLEEKLELMNRERKLKKELEKVEKELEKKEKELKKFESGSQLSEKKLRMN